MELYILRHGIAADLGRMGAKSDAERPLTPEGHERMERASAGMLRMKLTCDQIVSSPLVRTRQTAEIVAATLHAPLALASELAPGADLASLKTALKPYSQRKRLLVVGHEPDCSSFLASLTGLHSVQFKKGMLAAVDLQRLEPGAGLLLWLLTPAQLRLLGGSDATPPTDDS